MPTLFCGGIAHAGHIAALDGIRQKSLLAGILVVRCRSDAVTNGKLETELVGVNFLASEGCLVTERGQMPILRGFDAHGIDLDCAERVVDDLRIGGGADSAIRTNGDGQNGRNSDAHFGGCGVAANAAVSGRRERDAGRAGAARSVNGIGSRSGNGEGCDHADKGRCKIYLYAH